jgi:hypothetical protein
MSFSLSPCPYVFLGVPGPPVNLLLFSSGHDIQEMIIPFVMLN